MSKTFRTILLSMTFAMGSCLAAVAQTRTVTGTVVEQTDAGPEPITGVNVIVKGTQVGTVTDLDGNYSIDVPEGARTLAFSFIGFDSQEIDVAGRSKIDVVMASTTELLDDVVVVGYGVQRKSNLTGAISQVKTEDLDNRTSTDLNQAIQGKTAGVQLLSTSSAPGASSNVRVRGYSSNSTSNPLYVVDGVRVSSIANIAPSDIESIEVLKDAASAAIYGAEAGNGVILVTTKRGKKGEGKISYNFQYTLQSLSRKPKVMNAAQYVDYMVQSKALDQSKADLWDGTDTDWCDVMFETSPMQNHSVSFQNAGDKGAFYVSLNYLSNNGIVVGDKDRHKRFTGNINADYQVKKWLSVKTNNVISYSDRDAVSENYQYGSTLRSALALDPLTPNIYPANNLPSWMQNLVDNNYKLVRDENGDYYSISTFLNGADDINPNISIVKSRSNEWDINLQGNTALDFKPLKGLTITTRLGYRFNSSNGNDYSRAFYATATANQDLPDTESSNTTTRYYQWETFANYLFSLAKHNFTVMAGTSYSANRRHTTTAGGSGLQKDDELYGYPSYLASDASNLTLRGDDVETKKLSYFGRLSYDYDNRYMLQATMRADAADLSILPKPKRWGYFPAVSAGWTLTNEKWFPKNTAITSLKLRGSWGQNGSIAGLSNFAYSNAISSSGSYSFAAAQSQFVTASAPSSTGNEDLKWETSEQTDLGLDLSLFNARLTFGMDYYVKKTKDLIVKGTTPTLTVGNTVSPVNAGNVENKGWEFDLGWKDRIKDFSYSISANLATLKNEVTYLDPSIDRIGGARYGSATVSAFEKGYPVWYFRGYQVDHIDSATGNPVFVAADGSLTEKPSADDQTMIGSGIPDFTYGITISLKYKGVDLTVFGQGSHGNDVYSALTKTDRPTTNRLACYYEDAWTASNPNGKYARMDYQENYYWQSSAVVFDASYFKIKQIQLGYQMPKKVLKKIHFSNLRIYTSLDDFFLFTSYPGLDPEVSSSTTSALGLDLGSYPCSKKLVFGLNMTF